MIRRASYWLLVAPWYALGWACGAMVWLTITIAAALVAGYAAGRQR